ELRDVYDAEKQITRALPKMVKAAEAQELRSAFEKHLNQTRGQIERLEEIFEMLDTRPKGHHCPGMEGIITEGSELMEEDGDPAVLDAGLIGAAQKVEHYEIAVYGTLLTYANLLGRTEAADLLQQTLDEEKQADQKLTQLAEGFVNPEAAEQEGEEEEEEEDVVRPRVQRKRRVRV
ncbi:MAG: ferritin-like domain-containing protein, partial [Acidimicrobiia bacterium]